MVSQEYIDKLAFGRKYEIICQDKIKNKIMFLLSWNKTLRIIKMLITTS